MPQTVAKLDRDKLLSTPRAKIAVSALDALSTALQDHPGTEQLLGVATLFAAFCNRFMVNPAEMHSIGLKVLRHEPHEVKTNIQIDTLRDFAGMIAPTSFAQTSA